MEQMKEYTFKPNLLSQNNSSTSLFIQQNYKQNQDISEIGASLSQYEMGVLSS